MFTRTYFYFVIYLYQKWAYWLKDLVDAQINAADGTFITLLLLKAYSHFQR